MKYSNWILNDTILYEISQKVWRRMSYLVELFSCVKWRSLADVMIARTLTLEPRPRRMRDVGGGSPCCEYARP